MGGGGCERVDDADAREEHDGEVRVEEVDEGEVTGWEMNVEEMVSAQKEPIRIECRPDRPFATAPSTTASSFRISNWSLTSFSGIGDAELNFWRCTTVSLICSTRLLYHIK